MRKLEIALAIIVLFISPVFSQADNVVGYWLNHYGNSQIEIFKTTDGKYSGKIVWGKNNNRDKKDDKNPDPKLKGRTIMGLQILNNFTYDAKNKEWVNGTIYNPNEGKTYDCCLWFDEDKNELKIKGFVLGIRFLGKQVTWKRENNIRK